MSYLLKNREHSLVVSFCSESEDQFIMLATNSIDFFSEKITGDCIMDRINVRHLKN
jgi:hypothetical protein